MLNKTDKKQLAHLTGFRAVAAYLVLFAHSCDTAYVYNGIPVFNVYMQVLAYIGMSLFFVLSGFVITYNYSDKFKQEGWWLATYNFAVARFARLFPLYALFLLLSLQYIPSPLFAQRTEYFISFLTLTQSWFNLQSITFAPAWSISTECFFYLCFALWMLLPVRCRSPAAITRAAWGIGLAIIAVLYAIFTHKQAVINLLEPGFKQNSNPDVMSWLRYYSPYMRIGEFIIGACAARLFMATEGQPVSDRATRTAACYSVLALAIILGLVAAYLTGLIRGKSFLYFLLFNFAYAPFLTYLLYASSRYYIFATRWGSKRWMVFGGEISYSVYLTQFWAASMVSGFLSTAPSPLAYANSALHLLLIMVLTTILSYGSYMMLEVPCRRLLRGWLQAGRNAKSTDAPRVLRRS